MFAALLLGFVNGARTFTPPAVVAWAATLGAIDVGASRLAFLGVSGTATVLTLLAVVELLADKHPAIPSRRSAGPWLVRVAAGALCGGAVGIHGAVPAAGAVLGAVAAGAGTPATWFARARLARALGRDLPAALVEDAAVIVVALAAVRVAA